MATDTQNTGASATAYEEARSHLAGNWDERGTTAAYVSRQSARNFLAARGWLEESSGTWRRPEMPGPADGAGFRWCHDPSEALAIEITAIAMDQERGR